MNGTLIDTLIRENQGIVYTANIYEYQGKDSHSVQYFKNGDLIETIDFKDAPLNRIKSEVASWLDNIRVLKG
jgi:hypothetical protein